jgi:hypothetical protein
MNRSIKVKQVMVIICLIFRGGTTISKGPNAIQTDRMGDHEGINHQRDHL